MDNVARLPAADRRDLFVAVGAARGVRADLIEKDFWVCWTLKRVFALKDLPGLIFKGGTSLSKVYGAIERFSEDVDLSFERADLGCGGTEELAKLSGKKRRETLDSLALSCQQLIRETLRAAARGGAGNVDRRRLGGRLESGDRSGRQAGGAFRVSLGHRTCRRGEAGLHAAVHPAGARRPGRSLAGRGAGTVRPYAAEHVPGPFKEPDCTVRVLAAERTFWEKATLLHRWHYRSDKIMGERQSRHYYDPGAALERALRQGGDRQAGTPRSRGPVQVGVLRRAQGAVRTREARHVAARAASRSSGRP